MSNYSFYSALSYLASCVLQIFMGQLLCHVVSIQDQQPRMWNVHTNFDLSSLWVSKTLWACIQQKRADGGSRCVLQFARRLVAFCSVRIIVDCAGRKDLLSVVLPTKEQQQQQQQEYNNDDQFESLPAAATASSSSLLAVSAAQQSSTNIHLQTAVNQRQSSYCILHSLPFCQYY